MDVGVIASVKRSYRKRQISRALDWLGTSSEDIYKVDQLTVMRWIREIWSGLPNSIVHNFWRITGIIDGVLRSDRQPTTAEVYTVDYSSVAFADEEQNDIQKLLNEVLPTRHRVGLDELLNPSEEDDCIAAFTEEYMTEAIFHSLTEAEEVSVDAGSESEPEPEVVDEIDTMPTNEKLRHLGLCYDSGQS